MPIPLKDIVTDMKTFRNPVSKTKRNPKDAPDVRISNIAATASFGLNLVTYTGVAQGTGKQYAVAIQFIFEKGQVTKEPVDGYIKRKDAKGKGDFYHPKVDFENTPVRVKCSCADFQYRWEFHLFGKKALISVPRKYTPVPGSTRPSVNPKGALGVCKHLTNFVVALQQDGVIKTIPGFVKK